MGVGGGGVGGNGDQSGSRGGSGGGLPDPHARRAGWGNGERLVTPTAAVGLARCRGCRRRRRGGGGWLGWGRREGGGGRGGRLGASALPAASAGCATAEAAPRPAGQPRGRRAANPRTPTGRPHQRCPVAPPPPPPPPPEPRFRWVAGRRRARTLAGPAPRSPPSGCGCVTARGCGKQRVGGVLAVSAAAGRSGQGLHNPPPPFPTLPPDWVALAAGRGGWRTAHLSVSRRARATGHCRTSCPSGRGQTGPVLPNTKIQSDVKMGQKSEAR